MNHCLLVAKIFFIKADSDKLKSEILIWAHFVLKGHISVQFQSLKEEHTGFFLVPSPSSSRRNERRLTNKWNIEYHISFSWGLFSLLPHIRYHFQENRPSNRLTYTQRNEMNDTAIFSLSFGCRFNAKMQTLFLVRSFVVCLIMFHTSVCTYQQSKHNMSNTFFWPLLLPLRGFLHSSTLSLLLALSLVRY